MNNLATLASISLALAASIASAQTLNFNEQGDFSDSEFSPTVISTPLGLGTNTITGVVQGTGDNSVVDFDFFRLTRPPGVRLTSITVSVSGYFGNLGTGFVTIRRQATGDRVLEVIDANGVYTGLLRSPITNSEPSYLFGVEAAQFQASPLVPPSPGAFNYTFTIQTEIGPPEVVAQPASEVLTVGGATVLTFDFFSQFNTDYEVRWLKDGVPLTDSVPDGITGSQTPVLTLTNVQWADAGAYVAEVRAPGATPADELLLASAPAFLVVQPNGDIMGDLNGDGSVDFFDVLIFLQLLD